MRRLGWCAVGWAGVFGLGGCEAPAGAPVDAPIPVQPPFAEGRTAPAATGVECGSSTPLAPTSSFHQLAGPRDAPFRRLATAGEALYVASPYALRRSVDGGVTFDRLSSAPTSSEPPLLGTLGNLVFAALGSNVWSSVDGERWEASAAGLEGQAVTSLHAGGAALLARVAGGAVYRFEESSGAWQLVTAPSGFGLGHAAASDGHTFLVDTGLGVVRSVDLDTWTPVVGLEQWGYEHLLVDGDLGLAVTHVGEVRASSDAGATWSPVGLDFAELGPASHTHRAGSALFAMTAKGLARSADGGETWSVTLEHAQSASKGQIVGGAEMLAANLGAIRVSFDEGASWEATAAIADTTAMSLVAAGPWLLASTAERHVFASGIEGEVWQPVEADGFVVRAAAGDDAARYLLMATRFEHEWATTGDGALLRTMDAGATFEAVPRPVAAPYASYGALAVRQEVLALGGAGHLQSAGSDQRSGVGVWMSHDAGQTWAATSHGLPVHGYDGGLSIHPAIAALAWHEGEAGPELFAIAEGEGPFRLSSSGAWQAGAIEGAAPRAIAAVDWLAAGSGRLFAGSSTTGESLFAWSSETGAWSALEAEGLPSSFRIRHLVASRSPNDQQGALFAAVEAPLPGSPSGLYVSTDGGHHWETAGLEGPARSVLIHGGQIYVAVDGDAIWSRPLARCFAP